MKSTEVSFGKIK